MDNTCENSNNQPLNTESSTQESSLAGITKDKAKAIEIKTKGNELYQQEKYEEVASLGNRKLFIGSGAFTR